MIEPWTGLLLSIIFGLGYAIFVRRHTERGERHTAALVVIGVGGVLVIFFAVAGWNWLLLALFALAGAPMVVEYYTRPVAHE